MAATIAENSKIKFRYGSQSKLDQLVKDISGDSGTFYLTEDTHRLYVGLDDKTIVPVNEGIVTYATLPDPVANKNLAGQFAYIEGSGVLAVHNGKQWVHLNPDTDTTYTLSGFGAKDSETTPTENNQVTLTATLTDNHSLTSTAAFVVKGSGGILVKATTGGVVIDGPNLVATVSSSSTFKLSVGDSEVNFKTSGNLSVKNSNGAVELNVTPESLDGKVYNTSGTVIAKPAELTTGFIAKAYDQTSNSSGTHVDPVIKYGKNKDKEAKFDITTGAAELDVYTKAEVDALRQSFDAMTYVGTTGSTPTAGSGSGTPKAILKGDTWKASTNFTITDKNGSKPVKAGDLIIANGTETNGVIKTADLVFEIVDSGNEDTQYRFVGKAYGFALKDAPMGNDAQGAEIGSFEVTAGTDINIASGTGHSTPGKVVAQIKHASVTRNDGTAGTGTAGYANGYVYDTKDVDVIESITSSATGHITKAAKKTWTIKDTHATLQDGSVGVAVSYTTSGDTSTATAKTTVKLFHDSTTYDEKYANLNIKSINPNLQVTGSGTTVQMDLVWAKF